MTNTTLGIGIVDDLDDPEKLGRVRVRLPHLDDQLSNWARLVAAGAGNGRGIFFRPERGDEVVVSFEHGDPRRPVVLGGLWSSPDPPPEDREATENNLRQIVGRSGQVVRLDDTKGSERIEIIGAGGKQRVVIDSANERIEVVASSGRVVIDSTGGDVEVHAAESLTIKAGGDITVEATGNLTLRGANVSING